MFMTKWTLVLVFSTWLVQAQELETGPILEGNVLHLKGAEWRAGVVDQTPYRSAW